MASGGLTHYKIIDFQAVIINANLIHLVFLTLFLTLNSKSLLLIHIPDSLLNILHL